MVVNIWLLHGYCLTHLTPLGVGCQQPGTGFWGKLGCHGPQCGPQCGYHRQSHGIPSKMCIWESRSKVMESWNPIKVMESHGISQIHKMHGLRTWLFLGCCGITTTKIHRNMMRIFSDPILSPGRELDFTSNSWAFMGIPSISPAISMEPDLRS